MDYMNVCSVHAVVQVAQAIGGILMNIQALQFLCKHIDGLQTAEISTQMKDLSNYQRE